jgi:hypothetical protein
VNLAKFANEVGRMAEDKQPFPKRFYLDHDMYLRVSIEHHLETPYLWAEFGLIVDEGFYMRLPLGMARSNSFDPPEIQATINTAWQRTCQAVTAIKKIELADAPDLQDLLKGERK